MNKVTQKDFNLVKALQEKNIKGKDIQQITGRSKATVLRMLRLKTFAEYKSFMREIALKQKNKISNNVEEKGEKKVLASMVKRENQDIEETKNKILINICEAINLNTEEVRKLRGQLVGISDTLIKIKDKKNGFFR